mmetsp:Transcript_3438/g.5066  ORF Transcript_3438/g.5066 Transcript_3438/m.5066 type:complete len:688 (+) Transcript_3438:19-2082(+)
MGRSRTASIIKGKDDLKHANMPAGVILADSFTTEFRPLTLETPRTLFPLLNVPILEYIIEFLITSDIREIYICYCENGDQITKYVKESKYYKKLNCTIEMVNLLNAQNVGDALRILKMGNQIREDFLLLSGDVISNIDIKALIKHHREAKKVNKSLLMTSAFKKQPTHQQRELGFNDALHSVWCGIDKRENKILFYEEEGKEKATIGHEKFQENPTMDVRSDLIDCHIDMCTTEVLTIFEEQLYKNRAQLINNVLTNDILSVSNYITPYILSEKEYAARVSSFRAYELISEHIVRGWVHPITPDFFKKYGMQGRNNYLGDRLKLKPSTKLVSDCVIDENGKFGENTIVSNCVIGKNVVVGNNTVLKNAYIFDNVVIGDNVMITSSLLSSEVKIHSGVTIERGCVLSSGLEIKENTILKEYTRYVKAENGTNSVLYDKENYQVKSTNVFGVTEEDLAHDNAQRVEEAIRNQRSKKQVTDSVDFPKAMIEIVERSIFKKSDTNNAALEINSLRLSFEENNVECAISVLYGLLHTISNFKLDDTKENVIKLEDEEPSFMDQMTLLTFLLDHANIYHANWNELICSYMTNENDKLDLLDSLLDFFRDPNYSKKLSSTTLPLIITILERQELLEAEIIIKWYNEGKSRDDQLDVELIDKCKNVVESLQEEEEEETESEEDSDEETDSDDESY